MMTFWCCVIAAAIAFVLGTKRGRSVERWERQQRDARRAARDERAL